MKTTTVSYFTNRVRSFLKGFMRAADLYGKTPDRDVERFMSKSDAEALASDWTALHSDMEAVMPILAAKHSAENE